MIFYRLLRNKDVTITGSFTDVPNDAWYAQAVGVLSSLGILRCYEDGTFRPQNPITRAEFTAVATRFAKATGGDADFSDVTRDFWGYGNIATASTYGWVNGYGGFDSNTQEKMQKMSVIMAPKFTKVSMYYLKDDEKVLRQRTILCLQLL